MRDPQTEEHKIKLYKDKEGNLKGDGLCCYLKVSGTLKCSFLSFEGAYGHCFGITFRRFLKI